MTEQKEHLQAISDIRSMMERSSRCISLSGLSGVFAGVFALIGAYLAHMKLESFCQSYRTIEGESLDDLTIYLIKIAAAVLFSSLLVGSLLTMRNSKRKGLKIWDSSAKRLLINLAIPLAGIVISWYCCFSSSCHTYFLRTGFD
jgi:hypothetical protein